MEKPQSNIWDPHESEVMNSRPDIQLNQDLYAICGTQIGAEYARGQFRTASDTDASHESLLITDESDPTAAFQAASPTCAGKIDLGSAAHVTISLDRTDTSGPWKWVRPATIAAGRSVNQLGRQLKQTGSAERERAGIVIVKSGGGHGMQPVGGHDAGGCLEQLLVHCMMAIESNDVTLAQQLMWVLNNAVSTEGDPNQRVAAYFLKALISRAAARLTISAASPTAYYHSSGLPPPPLHLRTRFLSAIELAAFVDLTPWHRFGFSASNGAILEAVQGRSCVHIVDFSITHCMQWPTLIEALSKRAHGPPCVRLTVHSSRPHVPPLLNLPVQEVGMKLTAFARSKNVPFQFDVLPQKIRDLTPSCIKLQPGEILVINCQMRARYMSDEVVGVGSGSSGATGFSTRVHFMSWLRAVRPDLVTFVDEDADLGSRDAVSRLKAAFDYLWIPYDAIDTILPRENMQRIQFEWDTGSKIENIVACEGEERVERLESKETWAHRLTMTSNLQSIQFSEAVVAEVKAMLEEHAAGWSLKNDSSGDSLLLTWKGHNVVFAIACVPICSTSS